jgi:glycoside/pentoside/hexuronide:cation symporter, GPH family
MTATPSPAPQLDAAKLGWVTGELALACYAGVSTLYLLFYATEVLHLPAAWAGVALLVPRLWNILADPLVGVLSDRTHSRFGRRRPYLLAGALLWGAAFGLLFNLPSIGNPLARTLLFGGVFLLNNTGLTLFQVPYASMLAEFSPSPAVRTRLAAYREIASRVAILLTLYAAPTVLARAASQSAGFGQIGAIFGAVIVGTGIIAFWATAKAPATSAEPAHAGAKLELAPILENRPFAWITLAFLGVNLGDAVFSGSLVYYVTEVMHRSQASIATLYPVSSLVGIASAPLWTLAANRLGRARLCRIAFAGNALTCALPLWLGAPQFVLLYPFMCLYGAFNTGARLLPNAMVPDTIDLDRARTGRSREGVFFGIFTFTQQTGFAAGGFLLSVLLTLTGVGAPGGPQGASGIAHRFTGAGGILVCFAIATPLLYGAAFLASLCYRLEERVPASCTANEPPRSAL